MELIQATVDCEQIKVSTRKNRTAHAGEPGPRDPSLEVFLAFSRIFSGVIRDGQTVQVLSAAYSPARPEQERLEVQVSADPNSPTPFSHSSLRSFPAHVRMRRCTMLCEESFHEPARDLRDYTRVEF